MRTLIVLAIALAVAAADLDNAWSAWKVKYNKHYDSPVEEATRKSAWLDNYEYVATHNLEESLGLHTYSVGMNGLADLTLGEYQARLGMVQRVRATGDEQETVEKLGSNPTTLDWRNNNGDFVTSVKDQGQCGSCWSFSTVASLESACAIKYGESTLTSLSEQQLVSCDNNGDMGCNGGSFFNAWGYLMKYGGSVTDADYPYTSGNGQDGTCEESNYPIYATVAGYKSSTPFSQNALENNLQKGPVSVAIDASHRSFQLYTSGVYYEKQCSQFLLDHAVTNVGYNNADSSNSYWIIKNSWGTSWGNEGYIWMSKEHNNCGVATEPGYPSCGTISQ